MNAKWYIREKTSLKRSKTLKKDKFDGEIRLFPHFYFCFLNKSSIFANVRNKCKNIMLTVEKINLNYITFCNKLKKYNCYSEQMIDDLGEQLKNCSFSLNNDSGSAYQGSLIDIVLNHLCSIAYSINEVAFGTNSKFSSMRVNIDMLMRVLLLQHISKAEIFIDTRETWKINKGMLYEFNPNIKSALKLGERSLYLCQKYGISLTEEEYEAIRIIDKTDDDKIMFYMNPLCSIVKAANQFVATEMRQKYINNKQKETIEE